MIAADDYLDIVRALLTPAEIADYLSFRESQVENRVEPPDETPERALLGQYLSGDTDVRSIVDRAKYVEFLDHQADQWDMSGIIATLRNHLTSSTRPTDYYPIVRELALLRRSELREFKRRFQWAAEVARADEVDFPSRIAIPRTGCGFVFVPISRAILRLRGTALNNFTIAHKYDLHLTKCVGVSVAVDGDGFTSEWMYNESPWQQCEEMDELLQRQYPFRDLKETRLPRYTWKPPQ